MLLHFIMQDGLQSPVGEPLSHVGHRGLTHIEGRCKLGGTPSFRRFEQDAGAGQGAGVGFASMHKGLQGLALFLGQGDGWLLWHGHPPF